MSEAIEATDGRPRGWWAKGQSRPDGFGGTINAGTWEAKWQHTPTRAIRVPERVADLLVELARAADQQPDPGEWLRSLQPVQAIDVVEAKPVQAIKWADYTVAQLRKIAREGGMKTARAANRAELLSFLSSANN